MKLEIVMPSNLNECTLEQYQKFVKIDTEENRGTPFHLQKLVEIFCNIDLKDIANIKMKSLIDVTDHISGLFGQEHKFIQFFKMDGKEYGFIPLLDEISFGEYIDLDENLADWKNMHKAMAVLFRPITDKKEDRYDIEKYKGIENANNYLKMPLDVVFGAFVFFYHLSNELLITTLNYLEKTKELDSEQQTILRENGDGIRASMHSLKEMLQNMRISLN
tara:strand:+ start:1157 stop:1813 length:657 start_codon:yes stop_codon:yes gene_type:complete